ncbi:MAG: hypothetical protein IT377_02405 [Polyangiaceae bacterium]|nr:hypothetical protein [Polyangiaceae bacterium]
MKSKILIGVVTLGLVAAACAGGRRDSEVAHGASGQPGENVIATGDPEEPGPDDPEWGIVGAADPDYPSVVQKVVNMVSDQQIRGAVSRRGLDLLNVMWEDTGRAEGSSLGPNISDLTLQVRYRAPGGGETTALMPVIRFPNFTDRTGDVPADKFFVRVGNHKNKKKLDTVPLTDVLRDLKKYASKPWSIQGSGNMLAARDTHFLVSAQAVFLPIPKKGKAEFNPALFNYQSAPGSPAVLTLLVTRQGTSMRVIENRPEESASQGMGQELYFNNEGLRSAFTAERKSDVQQRIQAQGGPKTQDDRSALARGADVLFLIQIPLKHRNRGRLGGAMADAEMAQPSAAAGGAAPSKKASAMPMEEAKDKSDVEQAVLGHGKARGPFEEGGNLRLERDPQFPIRITVQFYKATSNGVADEKDLDAIAKSIGSVYEHAEFVGSLVLPEGDRRRPSTWQRIPNEWWPW